jgi:hypothetical protein
MTVFWDVVPCSLIEIDLRAEMLSASIIGTMMEAVTTFETSVNFYQTTRHNVPEDSHLHIRRHENLKAYLIRSFLL